MASISALRRVLVCALAAGLSWGRGALAQSPTDTAFTYQGQLKRNGAPLTGTADFRFTLWDAASGGAQVGPTLLVSGATLTSGLITAELEFGPGAFAGEGRWVEVAVRAPAGSGSFITLSPRQSVSPTPYALFALNGNPGPTGPAGPQGVAGPQGPTGPEGPAGATGPVGTPGATGDQGQQGAVGPTGPQGPDGIQGPAGPQGPAGGPGATGPAGPQGATGAAGSQGPTGEIGAQGLQGPVGPTGADGIQGPPGPQGPTGPAGSSDDGNAIVGKLNDAATTGVIGPTGSTTGAADRLRNRTRRIWIPGDAFTANSTQSLFSMLGAGTPTGVGGYRVVSFAGSGDNSGLLSSSFMVPMDYAGSSIPGASPCRMVIYWVPEATGATDITVAFDTVAYDPQTGLSTNFTGNAVSNTLRYHILPTSQVQANQATSVNPGAAQVAVQSIPRSGDTWAGSPVWNPGDVVLLSLWRTGGAADPTTLRVGIIGVMIEYEADM